MRTRTLIPLVVAALIAGACGSTQSPSAPPSLAGSPSPASESASPSQAPPSPAPPSPVPSGTPSIAASTVPCAETAHRDGTAERAQLTGVTAVNSAAAGSVVFTFADAPVPTVDARRGTPPFRADPSDLPVSVEGSAFWVVVLHGGTGIDPTGVATYTGPGEIRPPGSPIVDLVRLGDFEAVSAWVIGSGAATCLQVVTGAGRIEVVLTTP